MIKHNAGTKNEKSVPSKSFTRFTFDLVFLRYNLGLFFFFFLFLLVFLWSLLNNKIELSIDWLKGFAFELISNT